VEKREHIYLVDAIGKKLQPFVEGAEADRLLEKVRSLREKKAGNDHFLFQEERKGTLLGKKEKKMPGSSRQV